jgi:hypothetical protein
MIGEVLSTLPHIPSTSLLNAFRLNLVFALKSKYFKVNVVLAHIESI